MFGKGRAGGVRAHACVCARVWRGDNMSLVKCLLPQRVAQGVGFRKSV